MTPAFGSLNPSLITGSWTSQEDRKNPVWEGDVCTSCRLTVKGDELRGVVVLRTIW